MNVIGLTGGIACGKSTTVEILKQQNFKIIDADKIAHSLYDDPAFVQKIFDTFGRENVVAEDGVSVDRKKLGPIIFADPKKR